MAVVRYTSSTLPDQDRMHSRWVSSLTASSFGLRDAEITDERTCVFGNSLTQRDVTHLLEAHPCRTGRVAGFTAMRVLALCTVLHMK